MKICQSIDIPLNTESLFTFSSIFHKTLLELKSKNSYISTPTYYAYEGSQLTEELKSGCGIFGKMR